MSLSRFSFPTSIVFGPGARNELKNTLKRANLCRPLLVTDRGLVDSPMVMEIEGQLSDAGIKISKFGGIWGNPVESQVVRGVEAFRSLGADSIVGVGGGAALDVAKAIALMSTHAGSIFDYEDEKPGAKPIDGFVPPWIALPTTAGTGSEVGRSTVISDETTHIKKIIFSPKLLAAQVLADPELTVGLPASLTASTGMDALTHCVEAYLARGYHPICDGIALEGVRQAAQYLEQAVSEPKNLEARGGMLMASMMGAIAFQKGLGVTHSCAHALSAVVDMHHGLANGVMIDHALRFNLTSSPNQFSQLAAASGLKSLSGEEFLGWLGRLKKSVGLPRGLKAAGVSSDRLQQLARLAFQDSCHLSNPRPCTESDLLGIFQEAM